MEPLRSTYSGISLGLMFILLHVWMGYLMKSTAGVEEGWEAQAYSRKMGSSSGLDATFAGSNMTSHPTCWILVHLQKSGGSTLEGILKTQWEKYLHIYDSYQWNKGEKATRKVAQRMMLGNNYIVVAGGYTEGLRRVIGESCKWFAIFRHPVSRLVSAYFYCKVRPVDRLCASMVVDPKTLSLEEFAEHWGNFGLRQFVLGMFTADEVNRFCRKRDKHKGTSGWYRLKMYLDHQGSLSGGDENTVMYAMLPDVRDLIHDKLDAVGILEDFPTTLKLFDKALEMPGFNWTSSFGVSGVIRKQEEYASQEKEMLKGAWTNRAIKNYISLDLLLYEHAVDVFNEKAEKFGLK